jgi:hypothetical protein
MALAKQPVASDAVRRFEQIACDHRPGETPAWMVELPVFLSHCSRIFSLISRSFSRIFSLFHRMISARRSRTWRTACPRRTSPRLSGTSGSARSPRRSSAASGSRGPRSRWYRLHRRVLLQVGRLPHYSGLRPSPRDRHPRPALLDGGRVLRRT